MSWTPPWEPPPSTCSGSPSSDGGPPRSPHRGPSGAALRTVRTRTGHRHGRAQTPARRLLAIAQAATRPRRPRRAAPVRRHTGAQSLGPEELPDLAQSGLRGLVRVLGLNTPSCEPPLWTLTRPTPADPSRTELLTGAGEDEIALRDATRHIARLAYAPLTDSEHSTAAARTVRYGIDGSSCGSAASVTSARWNSARPHGAPGARRGRTSHPAAGVNFRDVLTAMGLLPRRHDAATESASNAPEGHRSRPRRPSICVGDNVSPATAWRRLRLVHHRTRLGCRANPGRHRRRRRRRASHSRSSPLGTRCGTLAGSGRGSER